MKKEKSTSQACLTWQKEVEQINLQISEQQALMRQCRENIKVLRAQKQTIIERHRKRRRRLWDDNTPMCKLVKPDKHDTFRNMLTEWGKYTIYPISPLKAHYFHFDFSYSMRPVYAVLTTFLDAADYPLQIPLMEFYRYLSAHSNLGSVQNIKVQLSRARKLI